jgi:spermidine synthase
MKKLLLPLVVFITGAVTMIFELAGSRILGPYLGTSLVVWTALIGIIMACLSLGYSVGGALADRRPDTRLLSWILLLSGASIVFTHLAHDYLLRVLIRYTADFRLRSVLASLVLFGPASCFTGMVLPFTVRLKLRGVGSSGTTVGSLYALSTAGSILGTAAAGFYLLPRLGSSTNLLFCAGILSLLSLAVFMKEKRLAGSVAATVLILLDLFVSYRFVTGKKNYVDVDTRYNRVIILDDTDESTGRPIRMLYINDERSSAVFLDGDGLVFEVLKYYDLAAHFNPGLGRCLMIGGSGYAYPSHFLKKYPDACLDVVEIDPGLTDLARKYFGLVDDPRLKIYHEDGRTFINRTPASYDAVFMDAYKSVITIPYQLTTREALQKISDMLNEGGVFLANIITTLDESSNHLLRAEYATCKSVFPQVYLFAVRDPGDPHLLQNIMLVAVKSSLPASLESSNPDVDAMLGKRVSLSIGDDLPVLTDEYAPVDYYMLKIFDF